MPHTFINCYIHYVFSTKNRQPLLSPALRERLYPYFGGIASQNNLQIIISGGTENHVHILALLSATLTISKAIQLLKGGSSKWLHDTFPDQHQFAWQEGYGAFSVSQSQTPTVVEYIRNQAEHHKKLSFEEEFLALLKKHRLEYDVRYVWG
jgi:putative transposase